MSLSVRHRRMLLRLSHIIRGTISLENGIVKQTNFHCSNLYPQCGQSDRVKKRSHRRNPPHSGQRQYFRVPKMTEPKPAIRRKNAMIFVPGISIAAMTLGTKREPIHSSTAHILQRYGVILTHPLLYFVPVFIALHGSNAECQRSALCYTVSITEDPSKSNANCCFFRDVFAESDEKNTRKSCKIAMTSRQVVAPLSLRLARLAGE